MEFVWLKWKKINFVLIKGEKLFFQIFNNLQHTEALAPAPTVTRPLKIENLFWIE